MDNPRPQITRSIASAVVIASTGAASGLFSPLVIQVGVGVMITACIATTVTLVVKAVKDAPAKPYEWTAGFAAIIQPIALDFVKEFSVPAIHSPESRIAQWAFSSVRGRHSLMEEPQQICQDFSGRCSCFFHPLGSRGPRDCRELGTGDAAPQR